MSVQTDVQRLTSERTSSLLHVPGALELNRLLAGPIHLRDQVDRVLQVAVVRRDPPEAEHDEGDRDRQGEGPARDGAGRSLDRVLNPGNEHEEPNRHANDQEHRPQNREDDPPSDSGLRAQRRSHAIRRRASAIIKDWSRLATWGIDSSESPGVARAWPRDGGVSGHSSDGY